MSKEDVTLAAGTIVQHYSDAGAWDRVPRVTSTGDTGSMAESKEKTTLEDPIKRYGSGLRDGGDKNMKGQRIPVQTEGSEHATDRDLQESFIERCKNEEEMQLRIIFPDRERATVTWKALGYLVDDASAEDWKMFTVNGKQNSTVTWDTAPLLTAVAVTGDAAMSVGDKQQLTLANTPVDCFWEVNQDTFESSDAGVLSVTKWGYVTAIAAGTATITVTRYTGDDDTPSVTTTLEVVVS